MSDSVVIKEFLVALGFKTDEHSLRKFNEGIDNATKLIFKFATAVSGLSLGVGAVITKVASDFDQLHFAAERTGASVQSIKAMEYAARQLGAGSGSALSALEKLSKYMRDTPGGRTWIESMFGVNASEGTATDQILRDIGESLSKKEWFESKALTSEIGFSDNELRLIQSSELEHKLREYAALSKNVNFQKMEEDARRFMQTMRRLETRFEALGYKASEAIAGKLNVDLDKLDAWFEANGQEIADRIAEITLLFIKLAETAGPAIQWVADKLVALDKETDGLSTKVIAAVAVFRLLGASSLVAGIWGLVSAMTALGGASAAAAGGGLLSRLGGLAARLGGTAGLLLYSSGLNEGEDAWAEEQRKKRSQGSANNGRFSEAWAMEILMRFGWTRDQAAGILGNLKNESSYNPAAENGSHYGLAQWDKGRQAEFERVTGKSMRGSSALEQLQFLNYELTAGAERKAGALLKAAQNADQASRIVYRHYERPGSNDTTSERRARDAVQISQSTTIQVTATGDPESVGRAVAGAQDQVNLRLARNFQGGVK